MKVFGCASIFFNNIYLKHENNLSIISFVKLEQVVLPIHSRGEGIPGSL